MKQITLSEETAKEMFNSGIESLKKLAIENYPELFHQEKKWEDFGKIYGAYIDSNSNIRVNNNSYSVDNDRNIYPTEQEAKSYLALIQLMQWRDKANGEPLNEWCDWDDSDTIKYVISICESEICVVEYINTYNPLTFKTKEIIDQFIKDHKTLLEEYAKVSEFKPKK